MHLQMAFSSLSCCYNLIENVHLCPLVTRLSWEGLGDATQDICELIPCPIVNHYTNVSVWLALNTSDHQWHLQTDLTRLLIFWRSKNELSFLKTFRYKTFSSTFEVTFLFFNNTENWKRNFGGNQLCLTKYIRDLYVNLARYKTKYKTFLYFANIYEQLGPPSW